MPTVLLQNEVPVKITKYRRARRMRITVHHDASVALSLPYAVSMAKGLQFLESKRDWIDRQRSRFLGNPQLFLHQGGPLEYAAHKEAARMLVSERLAFFSQFYSVRWRGVQVRNQRSRWGSCSKDGRLSFNYRLVLLPPELADYVIVHELCHLIEFNHSPAFWTAVSRAIPEYHNLRSQLRAL